MAGGGGFGNAFHRAVDAGVVFGDDDDDDRQNQPDQGAVVNVHGRRGWRTPTMNFVAGVIEGDGGDNGGAEHALVKGAHDVFAFAQADEENGDDGGDDGDGAEDQRELGGHGDFGEQQVADEHGGHGGHGIGLEQVGGHTGAVTHVVAHVVGDDRRVAGVVLGDSGFDLAHQVGADVGALGEDAAAQTGEDGDQAAAEAEGHQGDDVMGGGVVTGHGGQGQAGHDHAGHRAALEGHGQTGRQAFFGGFGRTHVGDNRHAHADVAGHKGGHRADQKADGGFGAHGGKDNSENDDAGNAHAFQLAIQVGDGAFLDGVGDCLHLFVSGRGAFDDTGKDNRKKNTNSADQRTNQRYIVHYNVHSFLHSMFNVKSRFAVKPIHSILCSLTKDGRGSLDGP